MLQSTGLHNLAAENNIANNGELLPLRSSLSTLPAFLCPRYLSQLHLVKLSCSLLSSHCPRGAGAGSRSLGAWQALQPGVGGELDHNAGVGPHRGPWLDCFSGERPCKLAAWEEAPRQAS